jgi:acetyl esterase
MARACRTSPVRIGADVLEETRAFNEELRKQLAGMPGAETLPAEVTRRARYEGRGIFPAPVFLPEAQWLDADGVRVRVGAPASPRGVYLHLHGGGWTLGAADIHDALFAFLAEETGLAVASIDYRLAPEHPYPAGPDDCETAARWLLDRGAAEIGAPSTFAIGGESAGAHLAVVTLLRLRDRHGITGAFDAANLFYGAYDLSGTPSRLRFTDALVINGAFMDWCTENFVPGLDVNARRAPDISPLYADLHSLPRALFTVGTLDPLLDDSLFMAARWEAGGNDAELHVYEDGVHGFNAFPIELARRANEAQAAFLSRVAAGVAA